LTGLTFSFSLGSGSALTIGLLVTCEWSLFMQPPLTALFLVVLSFSLPYTSLC
jgi:hypothetical protein